MLLALQRSLPRDQTESEKFAPFNPGATLKLAQNTRSPVVEEIEAEHSKRERPIFNKPTTLTESSGGLCILIHSTDGPFTCRNLWKRFLKPSKSFLDT
ncbi:hypothetical protein INR49_007625 [Caranx melampygus]|nr:hypothetical protein INR49_007625 [Caranx melampygus]